MKNCDIHRQNLPYQYRGAAASLGDGADYVLYLPFLGGRVGNGGRGHGVSGFIGGEGGGAGCIAAIGGDVFGGWGGVGLVVVEVGVELWVLVKPDSIYPASGYG